MGLKALGWHSWLACQVSTYAIDRSHSSFLEYLFVADRLVSVAEDVMPEKVDQMFIFLPSVCFDFDYILN